jgi:hypothetical protein
MTVLCYGVLQTEKREKRSSLRSRVSVYQQGCLNSMPKTWGCVLGLDYYSIKSLVVAFWQSKSFA